MIEPRIYRAAFIPAVLAAVLVAFSLQPAPGPLPQGLAADVLFDSSSASALATQIASTTPDRRPGTRGDDALAARIQTAFLADGFDTTTDRFRAGGHRLVNVVGRRPGPSTREIVVAAGRDAMGVPDTAASAADTAALLELANVFKGSAARHTLVVASLDGETVGDAGAQELENELGDPRDVDAVIVLSNVGVESGSGPLVLTWSDAAARGSAGLSATATASLSAELGRLPGDENGFAQLARLAFPIAPGAQGVLLRDGYSAVRISGSGELAPGAAAARELDPGRFANLGRGALRLVSALDASSRDPARGPSSYLAIARELLPGWAIALLATTLMLPALVASVDALARARRRREQVGAWFVWVFAAVLALAMGFACGKLFSFSGLGPDAPGTPVDPAAASLGARAISALVLTLLGTVLAWILVRTAVIRAAGPRRAPDAPGAGCASAIVLTVTGTVCALLNPWAALVIALPVHLWTLVAIGKPSTRTAAIWTAIGLAPPAAVAAYYMWRFSFDPLHAAYYLYLLVVGGQVGLLATLAGCILLATLASTVAVTRARARSDGAVLAKAVPDRSAARTVWGSPSQRPQRVRR